RRSDVSLLSWRMSDGKMRLDTSLEDPELCGAPLPAPLQDSVLLPQKEQGQQRPRDTWNTQTFKHGAFVDTSSGASLLPLEYRTLRWAGKNHLLAFGRLKFALHVPLPTPEQAIRNGSTYVDPKTNPKGAKKLRERTEWNALFVVPFDEKRLREQAGESLAAFAPRPGAVSVDRGKVMASKPEPKDWAVPAAKPVPPDPVPANVTWPDWPVAFGDTQAAILKYVVHSKPAYRTEILWDRYDLRTGAPIGQSIPLWPWVSKKGVVQK